MSKPKIELTETEWAVMKAVWQNEPCTAPAIQEKLFKETQWTYSTVRTLMDRMVGKGMLSADKTRNVTVYRSLISQKQAQKTELLYALRNAFNGALSPMIQCLLDTNELSAAEIAELETIIRAQKRKGRK